MINKHLFFSAIAICFFMSLLFSPASQSADQLQARVIQFSAEKWQVYENDQQGYRLMLPPEVKSILKKKRDREEASENLLPFDYVNFSMKQSGEDQEPFELGLGVHWNKYNLKTRVFADHKDVGVKIGAVQYVTIQSSAVTVAGIEGVRDDFKLDKGNGWTTYSRVIIPFRNNFICFLCTLGSDKAVPEYEQVFQKIIDSFEIKK